MTEHNKVTWFIACSAMRDMTELCDASLTYDPHGGEWRIVGDGFRVMVRRQGYIILNGTYEDFERWCAMCVLAQTDIAETVVYKKPDDYMLAMVEKSLPRNK